MFCTICNIHVDILRNVTKQVPRIKHILPRQSFTYSNFNYLIVAMHRGYEILRKKIS